MATNEAPPPASAASRTFAITELLENILLCVANDTKYIGTYSRRPAVELFALRRVSQKFNDTIIDSSALQQRMREAPSNHDPVKGLTTGYGFHAPYEPCLRKLFKAIQVANSRNEKGIGSWQHIEAWPREAGPTKYIWWLNQCLKKVHMEGGMTFGDAFDACVNNRYLSF